MTGVLTLCFYLKSHIISVSAHNLLGIRQDRLNINVHLEMILKTKTVKETFCRLQWKSFRSALALKKVRRRTCSWDLWAHVWPLLCSWSDGVDISKCASESESRSVMSDSLPPHGLYSQWNSPGQNTGVCSLSLLQGIFPIQGLNSGLPHCKQISYSWSTRKVQEYWSW